MAALAELLQTRPWAGEVLDLVVPLLVACLWHVQHVSVVLVLDGRECGSKQHSPTAAQPLRSLWERIQ